MKQQTLADIPGWHDQAHKAIADVMIQLGIVVAKRRSQLGSSI